VGRGFADFLGSNQAAARKVSSLSITFAIAAAAELVSPWIFENVASKDAA
jgi:hypothetical protein